MIKQQSFHPSLPDRCSHGLAEILELCWERNPKKRPTFAQLSKFFSLECLPPDLRDATTLAHSSEEVIQRYWNTLHKDVQKSVWSRLPLSSKLFLFTQQKPRELGRFSYPFAPD